MPSPVYAFRLFRQDQANCKKLVRLYRQKRGRSVDFATILRELMAEKVVEDGYQELQVKRFPGCASCPVRVARVKGKR